MTSQSNADLLREQVLHVQRMPRHMRTILMAKGYRTAHTQPVPYARACALYSLLTGMRKHIYPNDVILGSFMGITDEDTPTSKAEDDYAGGIVSSYSFGNFWTNIDHFAPNYRHTVAVGIDGLQREIAQSLAVHTDEKSTALLKSSSLCLDALSEMIVQYADKADQMGLHDAAAAARAVAHNAPATFRQGLQLVWFVHLALTLEGRYALALGRLDQYLYPLYDADIKNGTLTPDEALEYLRGTLIKISEIRTLNDNDDVVNIAIGGVTPDGKNGENPLSFLVLQAVKLCNIPGPNLTARMHKNSTDEFYDACLDVISTGLGYPALSSDEVNIPALARHGYDIEDVRDYCFVGCIENHISGKQGAWSDGRYNTPKYLELALNNGYCMQTGIKMGPQTGTDFPDMASFMKALETQMEYGASEYIRAWSLENDRYNRFNYAQPFLSCFCDCCIERGKDINDGGAKYPAAHGAGCMGIGTMADSLAGIEQEVYINKTITFTELAAALKADFKGFEDLQQRLLAVPKYGNDNDFVDKYAVWFLAFHDEMFSKFHTPEGAPIYVAIASNVQNICAGWAVAATPDGRNNAKPLSDAASPMHGCDVCGPTAVVNSVSKPDYTHASCATVLNQKFSPTVLNDAECRLKLRTLLKVYFSKGGQQMQINSVSRDTLRDAIKNPDEYKSLVVRVSGFSAYYTKLARSVQDDILARTEH